MCAACICVQQLLWWQVRESYIHMHKQVDNVNLTGILLFLITPTHSKLCDYAFGVHNATHCDKNKDSVYVH